MSIASLLRSELITNAGTSALVSTRVYPLQLPQPPTLPALSYSRVSSSGQNGTSNRKESRWQIDCWASTHAGVTALAAAVKTAMEEWHDISETPGVAWARVVNELEDFEDQPGVTGVYRIILDVILHTTGD